MDKEKVELKAYVVSTTDADDGAQMIFAESSNRAKMLSSLREDVDYVDLRVRREPKADKYLSIAVNDMLDFRIEAHKKILIEEFSWFEL